MPDFKTDDGVNLHYSDQGSGAKTLIYLHWMGGCGDNWAELIVLLNHPSYRHITLDARGHGRSQQSPCTFTNERLAQDVIQLADCVGAAEFYLVGHSFGGKVAMLVASLVPSRVSGLVLLGSVGPRKVPIDRSVVDGLLSRAIDTEYISDAFRPWFKHSGKRVAKALAQWCATPAWALKAVGEVALWTDISVQIGLVHTRTLVVIGSADPVYGPEYQHGAVIPTFSNSTVATIECGHGLQLECAIEISTLINEFALAGGPGVKGMIRQTNLGFSGVASTSGKLLPGP